MDNIYNDYVIKLAQVESVEDEADGLRIKARLPQDKNVSTNDLPYAFPLLPKTIQSVPKEGECAFIIVSKLGNDESNRYYIGPVISQPQKHDYDPYSYGRGSASSLLQGSRLEPLGRVKLFDETKGSFPNVNDVALVGRKSEDVILKDGEVDIRCGVRNNANEINKDDFTKNNLVGNVIFNSINPAYIQLKYQRGIGHSKDQEADSVINIVGDKINLISHKENYSRGIVDNKDLIKSKDLDTIMSELHELPYGDLLVEALEKFRDCLVNHVHAYPGLPPCKEARVVDVLSVNLNDILSKHIRIS